jgi:hypothetical protein
VKYIKIIIAACLALLLLSPAAAFAQQPFSVAWENGRLSVRASNVPIGDVFAEVVRLTGMEVVGGEKLVGRLSVDFADLAPREALSRMLVGANYLVQERPARNGAAGSQLVVRIHSMDGYALPADAVSGRILVRALEDFVTSEAAYVAEEREEEAEDDPDVVEERREDRLEASKLATQGAFGPKAHIDSLIKFMDNYNDEIRLEALKAIGTRPMSVALETLVGALGDDVWEIRAASVEILGRATDPASLTAVGEVLEKGEDSDTRIDALRVLALRGDPASEIHLRAALKDNDALIRDVSAQLLAELDRRAQVKDTAGRQ